MRRRTLLCALTGLAAGRAAWAAPDDEFEGDPADVVTEFDPHGEE